MGAPYSEDLRKRVLAAVDGGLSKWRVHQTFGVSRTTIDDWLKLRAATGRVAATTTYRRGPPPALADTPELRQFFEQHSSCTLAQLVTAWEAERGQRLSDVTFSKTLRRLGYTRKKSVPLPRSRPRQA